MKKQLNTIALMLVAAFAVAFLTRPTAAQETDYSIENVTGDLYLFRAGGTNSVFLVTGEGIILADPINAEAAGWLKAELDQRFGVPVRYVVYSHAHADHASGGEVFADTATFVSHYLAAKEIEENGTGPVPTIRFPHVYRLLLGSQGVELRYFGASHSDNLITFYFPVEKAVFLVDAVGVKRLPYRDLPDYQIPDVIAYLMRVEELDFQILIPGHGRLGTKADLVDHRKYLQDLTLLVAGALQQGFSVGEMKAFIRLEQYQDWENYDAWLDLNIEGMESIVAAAMARENLPQPVEEATPVFPEFAKKMWISGWVAIEFDVDEKGRPGNIRVVDSGASTPTRGITNLSYAIKSFEKSAIKAVEKHRFAEGGGYEGNTVVYSFYLPPKPGGDPFAEVFISEDLSDIALNELNQRIYLQDQRSGLSER